MSEKPFGQIIYTPEQAPQEVISKAETHTPRINAPEKVGKLEEFEVEVSVGPHPNEVEHSIRWIELYFYEEGRPYNPVFLARVELAPVYAEPKIKLRLKLKNSGTLYALEYCNLHGIWEARRYIKVE
ncbi:MAG: class II SORL domain-containing protein [Pyrodictiaceae archaeon]